MNDFEPLCNAGDAESAFALHAKPLCLSGVRELEGIAIAIGHELRARLTRCRDAAFDCEGHLRLSLEGVAVELTLPRIAVIASRPPRPLCLVRLGRGLKANRWLWL